MDEMARLAREFDERRGHLRAVAYRILGSSTEADDAVQEGWLRLSRSGAEGVDNLTAWLTTVVARVCLDVLRSRKARREEALDPAEPVTATIGSSEPRTVEQDALLGDSIGLAMLVVLETLAPAERVAFVLHDMFDLSFEEIAPIVGRSPVAARQLASRARRRVRGGEAAPAPDTHRHRVIVEAFLAASRDGNFDALLALLDPDVVLRADAAAVQASAGAAAHGGPTLSPEARGAAVVGRTFSGRARAARLADIDEGVGAVWAPGGRPRVAFVFTIAGDRISAIDVVADPVDLASFDVRMLEA